MTIFDNVYSPIQKINNPDLEDNKVELFIKRDDLIHEEYGGNKFRKLKYHIAEYFNYNKKGIITFGGAWSNHLYSCSALCFRLKIPLTVYVRGEKSNNESDTLKFARSQNTKVVFINRSDYKRRNDPVFIEDIQKEFPLQLIIPEGGSGELGVQGCTEILDETTAIFDTIIAACGTGGTLAGLIKSREPHQKIIGIPVLKGGQFLEEEILKYVDSSESINLENSFHFGGYAKTKIELVEFIKTFYSQTQIKLDPVYTGKMMFGILDMVKSGKFKAGSKILCLHTGGHQGTVGIENRIKEKFFL